MKNKVTWESLLQTVEAFMGKDSETYKWCVSNMNLGVSPKQQWLLIVGMLRKASQP